MHVTGQLQSSYATVQLQCSYPSLGKLLPTLHFLLPLLPVLLCHFQVPWPVFHLNFGSDFSVVYTSAEEDLCHRTKSRSGEVGACALLKWLTVIGKFIERKWRMMKVREVTAWVSSIIPGSQKQIEEMCPPLFGLVLNSCQAVVLFHNCVSPRTSPRILMFYNYSFWGSLQENLL